MLLAGLKSWIKIRGVGYLIILGSSLYALSSEIILGVAGFLGTALLAWSDYSSFKDGAWPNLNPRNHRKLASAVTGTVENVYIWSHSNTPSTQFAKQIAEALREAGITVKLVTGISAPSQGVSLDHKSSLDPKEFISVFRQVGIDLKLGNSYPDGDDEGGYDCRILIGDTP